MELLHKECVSYLQSMSSESIDAIITDPPYKYLKNKLESDWSEQIFFTEAFRILKPNSFLIFFGRGEAFYYANHAALTAGFKLKEDLVWDKTRASAPLNAIMRTHEFINVYVKGKKKLNVVRQNKIETDLLTNPELIADDLKRLVRLLEKVNCWEDFIEIKEGGFTRFEVDRKRGFMGTKKNRDRAINVYHTHLTGQKLKSILRVPTKHYDRIHPTEKPVELMELLIQLVTAKGDLILDPFAGSGSTGIAAYNLQRDFILIEQDKEFYDDMARRIENHSLPILELSKDGQSSNKEMI
jgi:site-specific DNA-methyltransferase (adenine-specific)